MKRFLGLILSVVGLAGTLWSGFYLLSGSSAAMLHPLPVTSMTGGLVSILLLTMGLIWVRD